MFFLLLRAKHWWEVQKNEYGFHSYQKKYQIVFQRAYNPFRKVCSLYLYIFIIGFGLPVDFQAVDEYNKYQWRIAGFHSSTYIIYIKTYIIRVPNCCKRVRKSCF